MQAVSSARAKKASPARRYDSSRRARQAAQTRADIVLAAGKVFRESGWSGATLAAIAGEAGVAVETIYSGFGSKAGVLQAAFDAAVVGDAEPVPLTDRPEFDRLGRGNRDERLQAALDLMADSYERSAGVWRAVLEAAMGDEGLDVWRSETDLRRRRDVETALERVVGHPIDEVAFDALWVLTGPGAYLDLVVDAGRSRAEYQACLRVAILRLAG
jgi:AcrR family transcriptional regulator